MRGCSRNARRISLLLPGTQTATIDTDPWRLASFGILDLLRKLVEDQGVDVNEKDERGMPPIIWAIRWALYYLALDRIEYRKIYAEVTPAGNVSPSLTLAAWKYVKFSLTTPCSSWLSTMKYLNCSFSTQNSQFRSVLILFLCH